MDLTICATPPLPSPPRLLDGQLMVELLPSFHAFVESSRNSEKFAVVPEESERRAMVIAVLGSLTPELSDAIAGSVHFVILPWKMFAMTVGVSCSGLVTVGQVVQHGDRPHNHGEVQHRGLAREADT